MNKSEDVYIRDYIFRETVSCPLKLQFIAEEDFNEQREDHFRRRTKRMLSEAAAQLFGEVRYVSDKTETAVDETREWLKKDSVVICGAVLAKQNIHTRIPILIKDGIQLTIVQVHGKLMKGAARSVFEGFPLSKSLNRYLLMAAYRAHLAEEIYPELQVFCTFMFPHKQFRAEVDGLYQKMMGVQNIPKEVLGELSKLLMSVDGTSAVRRVMGNIPAYVSHKSFSGMGISEAISTLSELDSAEAKRRVEMVHASCKHCSYRLSGGRVKTGCWDTHFSVQNIKKSGRHQFELIGHHVTSDILQGQMYQEQLDEPGGLNTSKKVIQHTDLKIAIYHRKAMQLLESKDKPLPLVFAKKMLHTLNELNYPIHFLDFEAASHAVPLQYGKRAYDLVLFQFSCHTLYKNGDLKHTQWLDEASNYRVHHELTVALSEIPDFENGTILQFSPFEKQALNKLYREMREDRLSNGRELQILENMLHVRTRNAGRRFLDLSVLLKDGYYNRYMNNGLSLKQILLSVLKTEMKLQTLEMRHFNLEGTTVDLFLEDDQGSIIDPYSQIADNRSRIRDGITAMHAYLSLKAGALSKEQSNLVPVLLKRYCTMDTLSLYVVFSHLKNLLKSAKFGEDIVIDL